jgi:NTE family protein
MIQRLCEAGRAAADVWLRQNYAAIGQRSTVDIARDYLDDTRMDVPQLQPAVRRLRSPGFRPWLSRLLRVS